MSGSGGRLRVVVRPSDFFGCGYYRVLLPGITLHAGRDVELVVDPGEGVLGERFVRGDGPFPELVGLGPVDADVVVLQRPLMWWMADAVELLQRQGVAVVVEVDDDFEALHPAHVNAGDIDPARNPAHNHQHLRRACLAADLVTVTTPALAERYAAARRVVVVPNGIPAAYLQVPAHAPGTPLQVGWSGDPGVHPGDLEVTGGGVGRAVAEAGARFAIVGPGEGARVALGLPGEADATGWVAFEDYAAHLARHDVGVVPLADTPFNEAKSWLKGLEMAALGVPFVASPAAEYRRLASLGAGVLAASPASWRAEVAALVARPDLRAERVAQARAVAAEHTIEGQAWRWAEAWQEAALGASRQRHPARAVTLAPAPPVASIAAAAPPLAAPVSAVPAAVASPALPSSALRVLVLADADPDGLLVTLSSIVDHLGEDGYRVVVHAPTTPRLDDLLGCLDGDVVVLRADGVPTADAVRAMVDAAGPGEVVALRSGERLVDVVDLAGPVSAAAGRR